MKKISSLLLMTLFLFGLTACAKTEKKDTSSPSQTSTSQQSSPSSTSDSKSQSSQSSTPQSSTEKSSSETPPTSSSKSIHTKEGSESDLGKARLTLYQEGIDSSSISDEKLIELYNKADGDKENFIALVKGMME